jgi:hypothetical protein
MPEVPGAELSPQVLTEFLASISALGRALQTEFDPRRFLAGFSRRIQPFLPHDRLVLFAFRREPHDVHGVRRARGLAREHARRTATRRCSRRMRAI